MAFLRTDSPISHSIVASFLQFLSSVETAPGTDAEGLEVAAQCLSEVFGLSSSRRDPAVRLLPLVDLFTASPDSSGGQGTPEPFTSGPDTSLAVSAAILAPQASTVHAASPSEPASSEPSGPDVNDVGQCDVKAPLTASKFWSGSLSSNRGPVEYEDATPADALLEQFREGLECAGCFDSTVQGTPEYAEKLRQAKQILDDAMKKVNAQPAKQVWNAASNSTLALAEAFKIQGNATMAAQRHLDAIQLYTMAISLNSNNAIFYANRAAALTQVEKYDEAIADCEVAIKFDPRYSKAYSRMGLVYFAQNRFPEAIDAFEKGLEIDPSSTSMQENLQGILATAISQAAQQKLDEHRRSRQGRQAQSQSRESAGTFTVSNIPDMANMLNGNIPEISNLLPGIMNMAAQIEQHLRQGAPESGQNESGSGAQAAHMENDANGGRGPMHTDEVHLDENSDGSFNVTFDGQQLPSQYAGILQSVFQQMGWSHGGSSGDTPPGGPPAASGAGAPCPPSASPSQNSQSGSGQN